MILVPTLRVVQYQRLMLRKKNEQIQAVFQANLCFIVCPRDKFCHLDCFIVYNIINRAFRHFVMQLSCPSISNAL